MSTYISQYVPEYIVGMVSRLKEATIDVGPQPAKFAKFSSIYLSDLTFLLTEDHQYNIKSTFTSNSEYESCVVDCLLVTTELTFEVWLLRT